MSEDELKKNVNDIARIWDELFERLHSIDVPEEFMADRPMNGLPVDRDIFGEDRKDESL